ncbi:hypothetical protein B0T19DRAFT_120100 [Cercophora scortea]|uniref:HMG box domain-containing protein n=1 Tax=Cercophora scortea TaxID=314031 RepID=A0AAE0IXY0_9PEZI|nr:hypothetical protein B0T19DRAFT_120100 [Cercophora scortea]
MAPASSIPPALPPSVEEAYRRKCVQLKQRTSEVEEANDAARLRLSRLKRQVEKMRLERAFLLEQLSKRTSANVEDSEGSPSPPPTPKEKPLRIKRGHRKPSMLANLETNSSAGGGGAGAPGGGGGGGGGTGSNAAFLSQNPHSPSSDAFSTQNHLEGGGRGASKTNGVHGKAPKKPGNAFDLYCDETRAAMKDKTNSEDTITKDDEGDVNMEEELARGWKDLDDSQREEFQARQEEEMTKYQKEKDAYDAKKKAAKERASHSDKAAKTDVDADVDVDVDVDADVDRDEPETESRAGADNDTPQPQEDVQMGNYDTDQETQGEKPEE